MGLKKLYFDFTRSCMYMILVFLSLSLEKNKKIFYNNIGDTMFKLYTCADGWERKDLPSYEAVISTIMNYSEKYNLYHYIIVENKDDTDYLVDTITNEGDFMRHLPEFKEILKKKKQKEKIKKYNDMSCVELKRDILKAKGYFD